MKAKQYYDKAKHKDDWDIEVVYPRTVGEIIELARLEGYAQGLAAAKEVAKKRGLAGISEKLEDKELLAQKELQDKFDALMEK